MLSADFGHLERDTRMVDASAAEWVHIDVMDGVFVPNISFGFPVLKAIRKATAKFLDVHLMIVSPEKYVARFAEAGADLVTFHLEATDDPAGSVALIRRAGAKAGVSIKPATPVEALREVLPLVDLVLVMSVEPGFGGQSFIPGSLEKIAQLRAMAREMGLETIIEVDGGISARNAGAVYGAGADVLVAGSSVFGAEDPQAEVVDQAHRKDPRQVEFRFFVRKDEGQQGQPPRVFGGAFVPSGRGAGRAQDVFQPFGFAHELQVSFQFFHLRDSVSGP